MTNLNLQQESNILRGVDFVVARGIWLALVLIALGIFLTAIPFRYWQLITVTPQGDNPLVILAPIEAEWLAAHGISLTAYALYFLALETIFAFTYITLGLIIYLRKSREVLGLFASLALITFGVLVPGTSRVLDDGSGSILEFSLHLVQNIGWVTFTMCFFIFPDGRFVPSWTRWLLIPFVAWAAAWLTFPLANPFNWQLWLMLIGFLFLFGCGFLSQLYRYFFVSTSEQKLQTRWVLYAFGVATLGVGIFLAPGILIPETRDPGAIRVLYHMIGVATFAFSLLLIPISINIGIMRYRLWNIDIIIRRTLVYGMLTATLLCLYLFSIIVLQQVFVLFTGASNDLAIISSTLGIAALFNPLRQRIQHAIDRRFYRSKYDAQLVLARFAAKLRDQVELDTLTREVLHVVDETMQPTSISLWLKK